jgi:(S)-ureidoglycine aminohydrolase
LTAEIKTAELFGASRSVVSDRYALLTPCGFANNTLPGWKNADCNVLISPALGAQFSQILIALNKDGEGRGNTGKTEFFIYVLEGSPSLTIDAKRNRLDAGSFAYVPPENDVHFQGANSRFLLFQKKYKPLGGTDAPKATFGHQRETRAHPVFGHDGIKMQSLLPDDLAFDFAFNIFTHQPGAVLPFIQTPLSEHGIMIIQGQGLFRLDTDYHPVQAGDAVWLAPYRPQWFLPMGKTPASYIAYTNANRDPM